MPTIDKPLFRPEALRSHLKGFEPSNESLVGRSKLKAWADKLSSQQLDKAKETELLPEFLSDVFGSVLGYVGQPSDPYTLKREALVQVDGKFADAALGRFAAQGNTFVAVVEGKGPLDPLDRPFKSRKQSAIQQALNYAVQLRIDWYIVTNLKEIRLLNKGFDTHTFERFELAKLVTDDMEFRRFVFLLGAERLVTPTIPHLNTLLTESAAIGLTLTKQFYSDYRTLRHELLDSLREHNSNEDPTQLLAATQKILDRVLFVAFCEDRQLLPGDIIKRAFEHHDDFNPRPVWENFVGLFRSIDKGNSSLNIAKYNGGLFADDPFLNKLNIPDAICERFKQLADYEFGNFSINADETAKLIDVEILGHIFEQSISDLEELHRGLSATPSEVSTKATPTKRKKEGAFYTPAFVTRYIVAETIGPLLTERFERLRVEHEAKAGRNVKKEFADPRGFDLASLTNPQRDALIRFWDDWITSLESFRVVDPSCGSGAFLIEAFDQLFLEYARAQGYLTELRGTPTLFDVQRTILTNNLFGMDLNGEAVEIARLSCWIKTAEQGKELTTLDQNIQTGNSVVAEPDPVSAWSARFPGAFADGGFDAVIGNPPYVRQEWISADKPFLKQHYKAYDGVADLYVYFYELGLKLLKPGGRLGFIVTNKWMKAGYGEPLRKLYGETAWVESVVDLGHNKEIFPDADVFPCILVARKPSNEVSVPETSRVCVLPREQFRAEDLSRQVVELGSIVPRTRFKADPWNLEPPGVAALMDKIKTNGLALKDFAGTEPLYGIKTGRNEAFIVDTLTRDRLIAEDASSEQLLKKYLRGQDIGRWCSEWSDEWMIFARRGIKIDQYPAIERHLMQYRERLEPKPKDWPSDQDWPGRKTGTYKWYELQDAVDYWQEFDKPKIVYQVLMTYPSFAWDRQGYLTNDKAFVLPTEDKYLIAVLNSPLMWFYLWRTLTHMIGETLSPMGYMMMNIPIAKPTDEIRSTIDGTVHRLIAITSETQSARMAILDWLRTEFAIDKPTQKLAALVELSSDELIAQVKKIRGKRSPLSVQDVKRLKEEHTQSVLPLKVIARESLELERRVSDLVNAAYGLTPDDVALMWQTAPPRMPIPAPTES